MRQSAAPFVETILRLIVAPFALAAAALAGLVFVVLLPICGIATVSEAIAKASWRFVGRVFAPLGERRARRA